MRQLQLDEKTARELYQNADPGLKAILNCSFGEKAFKIKKPFNEILTMADVFEATGEDPNDPKYTTGEPDEIAYRLLKLVPLALNPVGWKADWNNSSQYKWTPWFYMNKPGFRVFGSRYAYTASGSTGGSRLCFASEQISDHAGRTFVGIYEQWLS